MNYKPILIFLFLISSHHTFFCMEQPKKELLSNQLHDTCITYNPQVPLNQLIDCLIMALPTIFNIIPSEKYKHKDEIQTFLKYASLCNLGSVLNLDDSFQSDKEYKKYVALRILLVVAVASINYGKNIPKIKNFLKKTGLKQWIDVLNIDTFHGINSIAYSLKLSGLI